jgi:ABC-2 type transport system ATP-binding protein
VVIIKKGQVVAVDTPAGLTARLQGADRVEMRVQADKIDTAPLLQIAGVTSVTNDTPGHVMVETEPGHELRPAIAGVAIAQQWGLLELRQVTLSLEEIFLELTTQEAIDVADSAPVTAAEGVE